MTAQEKIQKMNVISVVVRDNLKALADLFEGDKDIQHYVWRINKQLSLIYQKTCGNLEKEITDEDFQRIIQTLDDLGDSNDRGN